ncbi:MAG: histone deacetylase [Candidatus Cloacimonetes bacterium]|nr:histone deacetylase [Candidatus Cloacimonadota bacterium]
MYPENKKRLLALGNLPVEELLNGEKYLELYHSPEYIEKIRKASQEGIYINPDTIVSSQSYEAAIYAVGASIMASESGDFAIVRPPGHHAHPRHSSGFCLFNNTAITVQKLVKAGKRVLIIDFDGHLGDGTEKFFYHTDQVLFWSIHQFPAFPGGGDADEIGEGAGKGYTINLPLPPGSGDEIFLDAFTTFLPAALEFNPDVVALSAGFDGHHSDLMTELRLSVNSFYKIGKLINENFSNVFAVLEGGYNMDAFPKSLFNFLSAMNGGEMLYQEKETDSTIQVYYEYEGRIHLARQLLSKYWKSL